MTAPPDITALARGMRSLFDLLGPQQVVQLAKLGRDTYLECRVSELARRANEGELTADEEAEYRGYIEASSVVAVLRAAARRRCQVSPSQ